MCIHICSICYYYYVDAHVYVHYKRDGMELMWRRVFFLLLFTSSIWCLYVCVCFVESIRPPVIGLKRPSCPVFDGYLILHRLPHTWCLPYTHEMVWRREGRSFVRSYRKKKETLVLLSQLVSTTKNKPTIPPSQSFSSSGNNKLVQRRNNTNNRVFLYGYRFQGSRAIATRV